MWVRGALLAVTILAVACSDTAQPTAPASTAPAPGGGTAPAAPAPPRRGEALSQEWLDALSSRLAAGRALWDASGPDAYEITYRSLGIFDCGDDVTTRVASGGAAEIVSPAACSRTDDSNLRLWTVDALFDLVERGIASRAYRISLDIDPDLGYPTRAYVNPEYETPDEEEGAEVRSVVAVTVPDTTPDYP